MFREVRDKFVTFLDVHWDACQNSYPPSPEPKALAFCVQREFRATVTNVSGVAAEVKELLEPQSF